MYEITVRLPIKKIERLINHLYQKGYYQSYYEVPLDVVTDANGYAFVEKRNDITELNIYMDNYVEAKERRKLSEILAIKIAVPDTLIRHFYIFVFLWCQALLFFYIDILLK